MIRFCIVSSTVALALLAGVLSGCVKQSDYEALQQENQQLQMRLDQANLQVRQAQTEMGVQMSRIQQLMEVKAKLERSQELQEQTQAELDAQKAEFEKFRTQRRSGMLGKKYPVVVLDNGKELHDVEITAFTRDMLSIKHQDGALKVALADSSDDLRWEACFDPKDAKLSIREQLLADARVIEARQEWEKTQPEKPAVKPSTSPTISVVEALRQQLAAQRRQMNDEYQALVKKNPSALRGADWDSTRPEASGLLNSLSGSRAVMGISRLQSQRDNVLSTLQQLRGLDPAAR